MSQVEIYHQGPLPALKPTDFLTKTDLKNKNINLFEGATLAPHRRSREAMGIRSSGFRGDRAAGKTLTLHCTGQHLTS